MPRYRYSVRNSQGQEMKGAVFASDQNEVIQLLQENGFYVTSVAPTSKPPRLFLLRKSMVPDEQKIFLLESWSMFMQIGLSVQAALLKVREVTPDRNIARALQSIQDGIDRGMKMSEAVAASRLFPSSWMAVLSVGERVGDFIGPLQVMRRRMIHLRRLRRETLRMLLMPSFLVGLSLVWFWVFLWSVAPAVREFSAAMGISNRAAATLSEMSGVLWYASQALALLLALAALAALRVNWSHQVMGTFQTWIPARTPILGPIVSTLHLMTVASELRLQLDAGIPFESALHTLSFSMANREVRHELVEVCRNVQQGVPAEEAISRLSFIPIEQKALIIAGNASGQLPKALGFLVRFAEENFHFKMKMLVTFLQTGVVLGCGFLVGLLVIAYFSLCFSFFPKAITVSNLPPMRP